MKTNKMQEINLNDFNKQCKKAEAYTTIVGIFTKKVSDFSYKINELDDIDLKKLNKEMIEKTLDNLLEQVLGDIDESVIRNC